MFEFQEKPVLYFTFHRPLASGLCVISLTRIVAMAASASSDNASSPSGSKYSEKIFKGKQWCVCSLVLAEV